MIDRQNKTRDPRKRTKRNFTEICFAVFRVRVSPGVLQLLRNRISVVAKEVTETGEKKGSQLANAIYRWTQRPIVVDGPRGSRRS